jgi:hypothetical protein
MTTPRVTVQTGNRIELRFDNALVGMIQSLRASDDYGLQEVSQVGDIHVKEWVPSLARHTLTVSLVQLKTESLEKAGLAATNGDIVLQGNVFDIVIMDLDTKKELRRYLNCSFASGDVEVTKHQIVARNATFMATDVKGDYAPSV